MVAHRHVEAAASLVPVRSLRFVEDGERRRSGRAWLLTPPPALPPGAPSLHPRHKLLDAVIPLARLYIQRGRCPRLCGHGNVSTPTLKDEGEVGLGREL